VDHNPSLAARLRGGETVYCGWSSLSDPLAAEAIARTGFDAVCLDMQHGFHDYGSLREGVTGVSAAGAAPVIRVPYGGMLYTGRMLDLGFEAAICPMINTAQAAAEFARATKFPPIGARSWGPTRAMMLSGRTSHEYLSWANREILSFAMIETREAISNLPEILAVEGIDAVFVGSNDLSISLSNGAGVDANREDVSAAMREIAKITNTAGKVAGSFATDTLAAEHQAAMGYRFIATGPDLQLLRAAAAALIGGLRKRPAS
jgi:4-hydroxy-2-oxoheptanedioate aldolase